MTNRPTSRPTTQVVLTLIGALVLLGGVLVLVVRMGGSSDGADGVQPTTSADPWTPAPPSTPSSSDPCVFCFPGTDVTTLIARLDSTGFTCLPRRDGYRCSKGPDNTVDISTVTVGRRPVWITDFEVKISSRGPAGYSPRRTAAVPAMKSDMQTLLPLFLLDPTERQQITAWLMKNIGSCPAGTHPKIAGYLVDCGPPVKSTSAGKQPVTTWTSEVQIFGRDVPEDR